VTSDLTQSPRWPIVAVYVDGMSRILVRRDEKSWGVPTPADVAEFHVSVTGCALPPHQTSICQKCLSLVMETVETRSMSVRSEYGMSMFRPPVFKHYKLVASLDNVQHLRATEGLLSLVSV